MAYQAVRGFGAACRAGLVAATSDIVCFMDADGSLAPASLLEVTALIERGDADLVMGARRPTTAGAWPAHAQVMNRGLALEMRRRTGVELHDLGPMRAAPHRQLTAGHLRRGLDALAGGDDAGGGLALDGGFWAAGLRRPWPATSHGPSA